MGKAANGKAMRARRKKRYERLNPINDHREDLIAARTAYDIAKQNGENPGNAPPEPDQWIKDISPLPPPNKVHTRADIDADVEKLRSLLPY